MGLTLPPALPAAKKEEAITCYEIALNKFAKYP
jgi:hypothetical protein